MKQSPQNSSILSGPKIAFPLIGSIFRGCNLTTDLRDRDLHSTPLHGVQASARPSQTQSEKKKLYMLLLAPCCLITF